MPPHLTLILITPASHTHLAQTSLYSDNPTGKACNMAEEDHRWMIETGKLSDFRLICQGEEIHVHKTMLASHSQRFKTIFNNDLQPSTNGVMVFEDVEPQLMLHLLDYFYKGTTEWRVSQADLKLNARLWTLAYRLGAKTVMFTIEKRIMIALESYESKILVFELIDIVFTSLVCSESALGYIAGEAAWNLLHDEKRPEARHCVVMGTDRYPGLATMMLWWSCQYVSFTKERGIIPVASTGQVREALLTERLTPTSRT